VFGKLDLARKPYSRYESKGRDQGWGHRCEEEGIYREDGLVNRFAYLQEGHTSAARNAQWK
jgi:hypothetical protein